MYKNSKKAQLGSTMTWFIATIIIIIILISSIALSEVSKKSRGFRYDLREFKKLEEDVSIKTMRGIDLIATKSINGFLLTNKNFDKIFQTKKINSDQQKLSQKILDMYLKENVFFFTTHTKNDFIYAEITLNKKKLLLEQTKFYNMLPVNTLLYEFYYNPSIIIPIDKKNNIYFIIRKFKLLERT